MVEENYFFRLSAYADRLLEHYEEHPEAVEPETRRNEVLSTDPRRAPGLLDQPDDVRLGHPAALGPEAHLLRLVRRADELHHRRGLRRRPRAVRADVAGEHPLDRQGHPPVPRDLLAGDADGRRRRAAHAGVGPRVPHGRRQEDVEDQRHRHPPVRAAGPCSAWTPTATTSCARSSSARTAASPGRRWSSATTPTSPTAWATSPAGSWRCSRANFDGVVPAFTAAGAESDLPAVTADAAARYDDAHAERRALAGARGRRGRSSARANHYLVEKEPWKIKDESQPRRARAASSTPPPRPSGSSRC